MWLSIAAVTDALAVLLGIYFLAGDAIRRSPADIPLILATLLLAALLGVCYYLNASGRKWISTTLAWLPATVILGYGLMIGSVVVFI